MSKCTFKKWTKKGYRCKFVGLVCDEEALWCKFHPENKKRYLQEKRWYEEMETWCVIG